MDKDFEIVLQEFNEGRSPLAHIDTNTFVGSKGQASDQLDDIISKPGYFTQSPGLADLTNGTQAGVVDQLIRFILDKPVNSTTTYAVGTTKLFKLSSTTVSSGGSPSWPQTVTDMAEGESIARVNDNLFVLFNTASAGEIAAMPLSTETIDPGWGSSTDQALEKAPHPVDVKEDIMLFGNGQYVGAYIEGANSLDVQKLDFGEGSEVADIVFNGNVWYIAVNYASGKGSRIYLYDASATSNVLSDEVGIGDQKIGFLYAKDGIVFVAYQDISANGYAIGYLAGRQLKPLRYFSGSLPNHRQKALYKNTIIFVSSGDIWSCGASVEQLPIQISKLADGGHATVGGIASPFGTPLVASSDGSSNHRLAKFSGYSTNSNRKTILFDVTNGRKLGKIQSVIVLTKPLGADARVDLKIKGNNADLESSSLVITGEDKSRHVFTSIDLPPVEDIRLDFDYTNGNTTNDCPIRKIIISGVFVEV